VATTAEQNFYEVLEVSPEATLQEIERAYRIARATYQPSSVATYSLWSEAETGEILRRVEEAYVVLSDARLRREYDARLRRDGAGAPARPAREPARTAPASPPLPGWTPLAPQQASTPALELDDLAEPPDGVYDGRALRRIRLSRGIELEEISAVTKINETYLRYLEEDRYPELPAPVYVRGFLREYARYLRLDPRRVTESYMTRVQEAQR
jgi:flagellar biosynthesis protein FlhG